MRHEQLLAEHRRSKIKDMVFQEGCVRVIELASMFNVSDETIRRDLTVLEKDGLVQKNYGGAVAVTELRKLISGVSPVHQRKFEHVGEKDLIGREASRFVEEDMCVYVDAGTTTWAMMKHLQLKKLKIVTNSIDVVGECAQHPDWDVSVIGGQFLPKSMCMVGPDAERQLNKMVFNLAFIGTSGISSKGQCTSPFLYEAQIKRIAIKMAEKSILLVDQGKLGKIFQHQISSIDTFEHVITAGPLTSEAEAILKASGSRYIVAQRQ